MVKVSERGGGETPAPGVFINLGLRRFRSGRLGQFLRTQSLDLDPGNVVGQVDGEGVQVALDPVGDLAMPMFPGQLHRSPALLVGHRQLIDIECGPHIVETVLGAVLPKTGSDTQDLDSLNYY